VNHDEDMKQDAENRIRASHGITHPYLFISELKDPSFPTFILAHVKSTLFAFAIEYMQKIYIIIIIIFNNAVTM